MYKVIAALIVGSIILLPVAAIIWLTFNQNYAFAGLEVVHIILLKLFFDWITRINIELESEPIRRSGGNESLGSKEKIIAVKTSGKKKKIIRSK